MMISWSIVKRIFFLVVAEDASCKNTTTEDSHPHGSVAVPHLPLLVPRIQIERSETLEQFDVPGYNPEKLHRVDKPPLRTPRVSGSNMLLVQEDNSITYGSPQPVRKQHAAVERTLSADSYCMSRSRRTSYGNALSPALSVVSSQASSGDKRSRTSSQSEHGRLSSAGRRSNECDYTDDFDESSDVDEGYVLLISSELCCTVKDGVCCKVVGTNMSCRFFYLAAKKNCIFYVYMMFAVTGHSFAGIMYWYM